MTTEVQWSELQRDPKSVAALVDREDVRVRRRGGAPLLLTREDRLADVGEGVLLGVRTLRNAFTHMPVEQAIDILVDEFPWLKYLPDEGIPQFIEDFLQATRASADLGNWSVLTQTIREWRATALIYTDASLVAELTAPIDGDFGPVPNPMEVTGAGEAR